MRALHVKFGHFLVSSIRCSEMGEALSRDEAIHIGHPRAFFPHLLHFVTEMIHVA